MSWQAQTAVNHRSKQTNMGLFRLLMFLAEKADEMGSIDPAPNQETLAEFFGCSDRTIRNRLNVLQDSGELTQTRVGSGPGNPSAYQINLEMPENGNTSDGKGGNKAEGNAAIISTFGQQMEEIKAEILELKAEKVETKGGKGGNERRKGHSLKSADDPSSIHSDPYVYKNGHTHEMPNGLHPFPESQESMEEMVSAISRVVKETRVPGITGDSFEQVARAFVDSGVTPEQVLAFREWWATPGNGYYKGKPALKSLLQEIQNSIASNSGVTQSSTVKPIVWNEEWDNDPYQ